jgi:hypothetical protein
MSGRDTLLAWITPPIVIPALIVIGVAVAWLAQ